MLLLLVCLLVTAGTSLATPPKPVCPGVIEPCQSPDCGCNAYYSSCPTNCPDICPPRSCPCGPEENCCRPACVCEDGYLRDQDSGLCIKREECTSKCGKNERLVVKSTERIKTCGNRIPYSEEPCKPFTGCICNDGFVRPFDNATGTCIPDCDCPPIPEKCGLNEIPVSCRAKCPPQSCDISYTSYLCLPSECEPGCNCKDNYLRNASNVCIFNNDCPPPGSPEPTPSPVCTGKPGSSVEIHSSSQSATSSQSSSNSSSNQSLSVKSANGVVTSQTKSKSEEASASKTNESAAQSSSLTVISDRGSSIDSSSSSSSSSSTSASTSSSSSDTTVVTGGKPCLPKCRPTCAVPNPPDCPNNPYNSRYPGACKKGFILSKAGGKCIRVEDCPSDLGCNGDNNAIVKECPLACPSTCSRPNAVLCKKRCDPLGCECKEGYILSDCGKCIPVNKCPGGNPCGENEIFVRCKVPCDKDYCPVKDKIKDDECKTPKICLSGCVCKHNYRRKSKKDPTCIPAEDCPPIPCTRVNEEWKACRPFCPRINCQEANLPCSEPFIRTCDPRCNCCDGFCRNDAGKCVPTNDCQKS